MPPASHHNPYGGSGLVAIGSFGDARPMPTSDDVPSKARVTHGLMKFFHVFHTAVITITLVAAVLAMIAATAKLFFPLYWYLWFAVAVAIWQGAHITLLVVYKKATKQGRTKEHNADVVGIAHNHFLQMLLAIAMAVFLWGYMTSIESARSMAADRYGVSINAIPAVSDGLSFYSQRTFNGTVYNPYEISSWQFSSDFHYRGLEFFILFLWTVLFLHAHSVYQILYPIKEAIEDVAVVSYEVADAAVKKAEALVSK